MSPRRNRPVRRSGGGGRSGRGDAVPEPVDPERVRRGVAAVQSCNDGEWMVRAVPAPAATKSYRCPGCVQEIRPGVPHVVAWPADGQGDLTDRRHWHRGCWRAREQRRPAVERSRNAPRYG
ncbi:hypothetical protein ACN27F_25605 [Solwaraspora sp. WMMB335]|uniref:hypothetical protein n=1 Tax=Solwaraspora sp. WMMB335 TaxID=3404118 RepID=UPI003B96397C